MLLFMRIRLKYLAAFFISFLLIDTQPALAAGSAETSIFSNAAATSLLALMLLLLIIIGFLGNILMGAAAIRVKKDKKKDTTAKVSTAAVIFFLLCSSSLFAQSTAGDTPVAVNSVNTIAGLSPFVFYVIISVIFLELLIILVLLANVRILLKTERDKLATEPALQIVKKQSVKTWWTRINNFRPVEQEADIDLGHDYDGIRELDNRLPPWWLYGFYLTIITAAIYLYRFHISHTGPSSTEEYEKSVSRASLEIKEYLKKKGDAVDENTVVLLTAPDDISAGKTIFQSSCIACHKESGGGDVGPNLTDDYWLHGGDIKSVFKTIRYGINAMPQWQNSYSNKQIAQVSSYIKSLKGTNPPNPKAPQGELFQEATNPAKIITDSTAPKESKVAIN